MSSIEIQILCIIISINFFGLIIQHEMSKISDRLEQILKEGKEQKNE